MADQIRAGTPAFRRTTLALFAAGFATFALLYCVQPLLPVFAHVFRVSAAASSLALSSTTAVLAPSMIVAGALSESRGRKSMMAVSLVASALLTLAAAAAPTWSVLLVTRAIAGVAFAGLPALSMAYLAEEVHPTSIGLAMGLTIAGNGLGGMSGRLLTALITDVASWRAGVAVVGVIGLIAAVVFWRTLPPSRHFHARPARVGPMARTVVEQFRDPRLVVLFAEGFLLMGAFVTSYNYITYALLAPPYRLSQGVVGLIFVVYLVGIVSSAWMGALADRVGRRTMLSLMAALMLAGVALTLAAPLACVVAGIAVITFGFFGGHSVASSWVGLRARDAKAQASALYLLFYYMGSSIAGTIGGFWWETARWRGVAGFVGAMVVAALGLSFAAGRDAGAASGAAPISAARSAA